MYYIENNKLKIFPSNPTKLNKYVYVLFRLCRYNMTNDLLQTYYT